MQNQLKTELDVLCEISSAVVHERNITALLEKVLDVLHRKMAMLRGTFTLRKGDVFEIAASHGLSDAEQKRGRYKLGEGITGTVAETGIAQLVPDVSKENASGILRVRGQGQRTSLFCVCRFSTWKK